MSQMHHGRGYVYLIKYHIVWCTKYRRKVLSQEIMKSLIEILNTIATNNGFVIQEVTELLIIYICLLNAHHNIIYQI